MASPASGQKLQTSVLTEELASAPSVYSRGALLRTRKRFRRPLEVQKVIKNIRSGRATGLGSYWQRILGAKMSNDALSLVSVMFATFSKLQLPR